MEEQLKEYSESFHVTPAECNPEQRLPLTVLVSRIIEVATLHANSWNVGFNELAKSNQTWVLSRVTTEMKRYPNLNEKYTLTTWIESYNRHFSERNFEIRDGKDQVIGHARTIWVVIDSETRESVDISRFEYIKNNISDRVCPIARQSRMRPVTDGRSIMYRFLYSDVDFNRHINSCKYIELFLNQWSLDFHDTHRVSRMEIAYMKETYYNEEVEIRVKDNEDDSIAELLSDGVPLCRARFEFEKRNYLE